MQILQILGRTTRQGPRRAYARALGGAPWDLASFQSKGPPRSGANPPHLPLSCDDAGHRRSGSPTDLHGLGLQRTQMRMRLGLLWNGVVCHQGRPSHNHNDNFNFKVFASDAAGKRHLMKNPCVFSVFYCIEGALDATSRGTQNRKVGRRKRNPKMVVVVIGPSLMSRIRL